MAQMSIKLCAVSLASLLLSVCADAANWPQFRGPNGSGVAEDADFPIHFGPKSNLVWQVEIPSGNSSPVVWNDRIFVTGFADDKLQTLCLDLKTGKELWRQNAPSCAIEAFGTLGSPACSTPVTDGERVYVYFGSYGLLAYDWAGRELWKTPLTTPITQHGTGTSPILAENQLILLCDQDVGSYLMSVNPANGQTLWKTERPGFRRGFTTPLYYAPDKLLIIAGALRARAYNVADGTEHWQTGGLPNELCTTPVTGSGLIFLGGWTSGSGVARLPDYTSLTNEFDLDHDGRISRAEATSGPAQQHFPYIDANKDGFIVKEEWETIAQIFDRSENALLAIKPGGTGDISQSHVVWKYSRGLPYVPSPLYYRDRLYFVRNGGLFTCLNATNGTPLYKEERIGANGNNYSSPVAANGRICVISQQGVAVVIEASDSFRILAKNPLEEPVLATPAIVQKRIYIRTRSHLCAFGE